MTGKTAKTMVLSTVAAVAAIGGVATRAHGMPERPGLSVPRCETPPVVDADLSDPCWQKATTVQRFYIWLGQGQTTTNVTARVICDDSWLYVAFEVVRPHPEVIQPTVFDHDGSISADDSVEVFLDPGTEGKIYYHYMLNAVNARAERKCVDQGSSKDITWDMPWRSATRVTGTGWQAEIGLPLSVLANEGDIAKTTLNLCANRVLVTLNFANVVVGNVRESSSWAPVDKGFHEPLNFGHLRGLDPATVKQPLLVAAQAVKAGRYASGDDGGFYYEVSGTLRSYTATPGALLLVAEDKPADGPGGRVSREVKFDGAGEQPFQLRVPVTAFCGRTAELSLRDPATGEVLQDVVLRDLANLSLMRAYPRTSYFTSEKDAAVACEIGLPSEELAKVSLFATDKRGAKLGKATKVTARTFIPVPLRKLRLGSNTVAVELRRKGAGTLLSQEVSLIKRAPKPGCEWKLDLANKVILNNGKPFFLFGIMTSQDTTSDGETMIADIADIGFNTVCRFGGCPLQRTEELLTMARKHNLYVMDYPAVWRHTPPANGAPAWDKLSDDERWDWLTENVWLPGAKALMGHPNLIGWYLADEPQGLLPLAARILRLYERVHALDGYHPTEVLYIPPIPEGDTFSRNCDILGIDPYWVPGSGIGEAGTPNSVARQTWLARKRADRDLKLLWVTPCAERFSGTGLRIFSENEQRAQTYLSLIDGAKALLYFVYPFVHESTRDTFARLAAEMKVIGPACVTPEVGQTISYTPVALDPHSNLFPDVRVRILRNPAGGYLLLAASYRPYPADATFTMPLLARAGNVRKLFVPDGAVGVKDGLFSDHFAPMDTRAYAIEGVPETSEPIALSVHIAAQPGKPDRLLTAVGVPPPVALARKNMLQNSGFEQCSIPGIPDYYLDFRTDKTREGYRLGDKRGDPLVSVTTDNPYEGKQCLRMNPGFFLFTIAPPDDRTTQYVFSAYVRGIPDGSKIGFYGAADQKQFHPLTNEWQRISTTIRYPFGGEGGIFGFHIARARDPEKPGDVWIDAMQFERGETPTEYSP